MSALSPPSTLPPPPAAQAGHVGLVGRGRWAALLALVVLATLLRLPGLSWLPSPAGDEGNWASYAEPPYHGQSVQLISRQRGSCNCPKSDQKPAGTGKVE